MKNILLLCIILFIFSCKNSNEVIYTIKVHYCNEVSWSRDSIFKVRSDWYPSIETYNQALPTIYRQYDTKILNVCAFEVIKTDTIQ